MWCTTMKIKDHQSSTIRFRHSDIYTTINFARLSVSDGSGRLIWGLSCGWLGVVGTRYRVSQPAADADRYRCACLTQGLAGRGDGYQCGLGWWRSSTYNKCKMDGRHFGNQQNNKSQQWSDMQKNHSKQICAPRHYFR